jgi:hypothetical protein
MPVEMAGVEMCRDKRRLRLPLTLGGVERRHGILEGRKRRFLSIEGFPTRSGAVGQWGSGPLAAAQNVENAVLPRICPTAPLER